MGPVKTGLALTGNQGGGFGGIPGGSCRSLLNWGGGGFAWEGV